MRFLQTQIQLQFLARMRLDLGWRLFSLGMTATHDDEVVGIAFEA